MVMNAGKLGFVTSRPVRWLTLRHYFQQKRDFCRSEGPVALRDKKPKSRLKNTHQLFVDWKKVQTIGGNGGDGSISFLRIKFNPTAGPSGGDGGNGGHVVFRASKDVNSLSHVPSLINAENGEKGMPKDCHGKNAENTVIEVPVGTIVKSKDEQMYDMFRDGDLFVAARGGAGGKGNHYFTTSLNQTPKVAEKGAIGERNVYYLEMRVIADVGLIGFPNAGKSTFLRAISRARPRVASYPFTTLQPHIGMVLYDDYVQMAVADIPGLIPDSHKNRGLGISFLRHVQRCRCLLYILDLSVPQPWLQLQSLQYELDQFLPGLASKPNAVIANKADLPGAEEKLQELKELIDLPVFEISAKYGIKVAPVLRYMRQLYDNYHRETP